MLRFLCCNLVCVPFLSCNNIVLLFCLNVCWYYQPLMNLFYSLALSGSTWCARVVATWSTVLYAWTLGTFHGAPSVSTTNYSIAIGIISRKSYFCCALDIFCSVWCSDDSLSIIGWHVVLLSLCLKHDLWTRPPLSLNVRS